MSAPPSFPPRLADAQTQQPGQLSRLVGGGWHEWPAAVVAALQAGLLSLLVVVLPSVAALLTATTDPGDRAGLVSAAEAGVRIWLLGHGVPVAITGAQVSLVPLGVTALAVYTLDASTRRTGVGSRAGLLAGTGCYALITGALAAAIGLAPSRVAAAVGGGLVVGAVGTGCGLARRADTPSWRAVAAPVRGVLPKVVLDGVRAAAICVGLITALAAALVTVWVLAGRATIGDVVRGLPLDAVGGGVYALAQLAYLPDLVAWAVAWLAGPGFVVGSGTLFSPGAVHLAPLPAIPLLGALPTSASAGRTALLAPLVVVVVGVLAGLFLSRRARATRWWQPFAQVGVLAATVAVVVGATLAAASGAVGPGRMTSVGAVWWSVGPLVGGLVGLGALVGAVPTSAAFRSGLRACWAAVRRRDVSDAS